VKFCVLSSGSTANSTFVSSGRTRLLIDAGLSRRELFARLAAIGERAEALDAILITHEHTDHVGGLVVLARKLDIPIYMTHRTAPAVAWDDYTPKLVTFQAGMRLSVGDFEIDSFTVPHDAIDPVGFSMHAEGLKIGIVTDLGYVPDSIKYHLRGAHLLVLESNHDLEMLKVGPYPWWVKQRVMGRHGHLSNENASDFIRQDMDATVVALILAHLSAHNNHPELARLVAKQALNERGMATRLVVAEHGKQTEVIEL